MANEKPTKKFKPVKPFFRMNKDKILKLLVTYSTNEVAKRNKVSEYALRTQLKEWGIIKSKSEGLKKAHRKKCAEEVQKMFNEKKERLYVLCSVTNYIVPNKICDECQIKAVLQESIGGTFICANAFIQQDMNLIKNYNQSKKISNDEIYKRAKENAGKNQAKDNADIASTGQGGN